jgi:hypothetical protein
VAVKDAVGQMPQTRGNTGGLNRPINPDNQPLDPPGKRRGYGATPEVTPIDSKIGWRGQQELGYGADKVGKVMHEFKHGKLHSGSKRGPKVKSRKQAIAIGLSEARRSKEK